MRLEPLRVDHSADLYRNYCGVDLRYIWTWPQNVTQSEFDTFIEQLAANKSVSTFAVILKETGEAIGSTSYMSIRQEHKGLEIGSTWYSIRYQGSFVNPECKYLLLEHAFERWDAERVQLKCDERNEHSRSAILKLGATFEGVLRKHILLPDGFARNTAMYSIIKTDWTTIKEKLAGRLQKDFGYFGNAISENSLS